MLPVIDNFEWIDEVRRWFWEAEVAPELSDELRAIFDELENAMAELLGRR